MPGTGEEQQAAGGGGAGRGWARAFGRPLQAGADESAAGATGSDPGTAGRTGAGTSGLASGGGAHALGADSAVGGRRISGNWRGGASGSGRSFTGVKSGSGQQLAKDCHGVLGRFRAWRELGGKLREIGGTIRGRTEVLGRFRAELETRQRLERISLGKAHSEAVRKIESLAGEVYRGGMEGAEGRAREATRRDPLASV